MFSLSTTIRVYFILSIVVMAAFFIALTSIDVILEPVWEIASSETNEIFLRIYVSVIIMSLIAIVFGVVIIIFVYDRGINKYQDLIRRIENVSQYNKLRPATLRFPDQDEFGNLGTYLNNFLAKIDYYDQTKTILAQMEKQKFQALAGQVEFPVLLINTEVNEPYISYYNNAFRDTFLKKSVFIDNYGRPQIQYFNLEQTPIVNFNIKNQEQTPFFEEIQINRMKNNNIILEKPQTFHKSIFSDLSGEKTYEFEELICVPLNSSLEKMMCQMLYLFLKPKEIEKKNSNIES